MADHHICIVGAKGMLGRELVLACPEASAFDLPELDIVNADQVKHTLSKIKPDVLINAAAYTDVDGCETEKSIAQAVNVDGVANLASACQEIGCRMVQVSTDYVFDGRSDRPYLPDDPVCPINEYGRTKAEGESSLREVLSDHLIVRTSWMFGPFGRNFVKTILRLANSRDVIRVVTDQVGSPTYARDLAAALLALAGSDHRGTGHFTNAGHCSWYEFACQIVRRASLRTRIEPTTSAETARPAPRPPYSVLDTAVLTRMLGAAPRPWEDALSECLAEIDPSDNPSPK
jgi:dTDP-4-dehydrorhamnose reductase